MGIVLLVAALLSISGTVLGVSVTLDQQALLSFRALIISDPHGVLSSWNASNGTSTNLTRICGWRGVGCHSRRHPGRVTSLKLPASNLKGTISSFLANLTFLHILDLSLNSFSGNIPSELGFLPRLSHLDLQNNSLQGVIPLSLARASKLQTLELDYNNLVGDIPANLSNLSELEVLGVGSNQLSGLVPTSLGSLSKLTYLNLNWNNLSGGVPPSLGNLSSLLDLYAGSNRFSGKIPDSLGRLTELMSLNLAYNHLSGNIPASLFNISSIGMFELSGNNALSDVLPFDIGVTLPNLHHLILNDCQLSGQIPHTIGNATRLKYIQLDYNKFEGTVPLEVGNLKDLEVLIVGSNQLEDKWGSDWELIMSLSNCSKLLSLALGSNNFQDMWRLQNLTVLGLRGNFLSGNIPPSIGELYNIGLLDLSQNNISGEIPVTLGNLTSLSVLYLFENNLQGSIPTSLGKLQNIASLILSSNQLSGTVPEQIVSLSSLTNILDLSYNFLSGLIPSEIGKLMNLVLLDLSVNELSGDIPPTLGKCIELVELDLNDNLFQGVIPQSLSGLQGIQELNIAGNNLSGPVPEFFGDWPNLEYLNLSYNNFEGHVPVKGVFSNASAFFIAGNNNACGGIPSLQLPQCPVRESSVEKKRPRRVLLVGIVAGAMSLLLILLIYCLLLLIMRRKHRVPNLPLSEDQHWQISFDEIQNATNHFSPSNLIGMGSFGSVYSGILSLGEQRVAIKVINIQQHGAEHSFLAECRTLRSVRHRNLVKVVTACSSVDHQGNDFKALVFEYMPNGDLDKWLHHSFVAQDEAPNTRRRLTMSQRVNIALDVAEALDYLHHRGEVPIVHCDLKPSNVLLDDDMVAHVADFGLSRFIPKTVNNSTEESSTSIGMKGTIGYIPPEYGMDGNVSIQGDVYSYGVLLLEMFTGKRPTDSSFQGGQTFQSYVAACYPDRIMEIIESTLLPMDNGFSCDEIDAGKLQECMVSIFRVGLQCSQESSRARMDIRSAIRDLEAVKDALRKLAGVSLQQEHRYIE
ncbi:unnamed protein product [Urochloa decumbens]|uniref:Receptor kinase-like protein Xa21 n=1 Tax=Urochloa decumbens TaxID=240449 RepID=A0ABC8WBX7_9POAL